MGKSGGSSYESDEFNGLSHLAEHLLMNAEDVINEQYKYLIAEITDNGVMYNAATTKEYTCFHFTGLANTLETCICALAHCNEKQKFLKMKILKMKESCIAGSNRFLFFFSTN